MRKERYLEKLELFECELEFIASHDICDDVTERALLHSLQTCVEISVDIAAMLTKDAGLVAEDRLYQHRKVIEGRHHRNERRGDSEGI